MPRPNDADLIDAYKRDLRSDIESNAKEIAKGRTDLIAYDAKIRAELAALEVAKSIGVDR